MVNTELTKAKRFELGLRQEIKGIMAAQQYTIYAEALCRTQAISTGLGLEKKILPSSEVSKKRECNELYAENGNGQNKKANNGPGSSKPNEVIPPCPKCSRTHRDECLYRKNVCYRCDKSSHIVQNYQEPPPKKDNKKGKGEKATVFALNQQEAVEAKYQEHSD
ncbi:Pepsin-retropepsin like protein [Abeliophyllum distichum]|uniref:Pepsin-retropepsin like protein n=1 Tax=Abeliophyllum distichum TaxID=126358 RepID=A0ABD1SBF1_9LAMI